MNAGAAGDGGTNAGAGLVASDSPGDADGGLGDWPVTCSCGGTAREEAGGGMPSAAFTGERSATPLAAPNKCLAVLPCLLAAAGASMMDGAAAMSAAESTLGDNICAAEAKGVISIDTSGWGDGVSMRTKSQDVRRRCLLSCAEDPYSAGHSAPWPAGGTGTPLLSSAS